MCTMIKNIILDFGDVFMDINDLAFSEALEGMGVKDSVVEWYILLFIPYEKGTVSTPEFFARSAEYFPDISESELIHILSAAFGDFPEERLVFLEALAQENQYRLFLLTNINELNMNYVKQSMGGKRFRRFTDSFEACYLSYEVGLRKPDKAFFNWVLEQNNLKASETLFVDDFKENTKVAESLGLKVWNLKAGKEDVTQLRLYL